MKDAKKNMSEKPKTWQELPIGGIILDAGNSVSYETGSWRTWRPVFHPEACIHCLTCWVFCPEEAFLLQDGQTSSGRQRKEIKSIDYEYCKGCGLCVRECLVNKQGKKTALTFEREER